ncbi:MAG: preprotein translocase subunit SecY [Cytophagales bacterium]|nr:MAG: preprotein translocase subunit SecY [Cytophagales bacterium]
MKKFITTIRNIFSIDDLRVRIVNTILLLLIFRLGSFVVLPGIDPIVLQKANIGQSGIFGFIDTFLGGAFSKASIFALGIMPYISASIVVQLLSVASPFFQKMQKEGESGRNKLNQITRYLTIVITLAQSVGYLTTTIPSEALLVDAFYFNISSMIILTAGTIFCMWLGERITERGIGNGISMLIMIGIISRFPAAIIQEGSSRFVNNQVFLLILEAIALFFVVMGVVMLTQATRKISVQYAKQVIGNKVYGGQRQYIPLKVNAAGVMPIIFAQSLMFLPAMLASIWAESSDIASFIGATFANPYSWQYNLLFATLIVVFTYFYTAISVNPTQIADDMKRNGGFIPGVKPGVQTAEHIDTILSKITFPGALFLAVIAILPSIANLFGITSDFAQFYGGTSLLIMVGVILDTLQQINSYLLMKRYEGLMKSGKVKGKTQNDIAIA